MLTMKSSQRVRRSPEDIRGALAGAGLAEDPKLIDGHGFTFLADPIDAIQRYRSRRGAEPTRFHIDHHMFILTDVIGVVDASPVQEGHKGRIKTSRRA
jgi:hypothetical protein